MTLERAYHRWFSTHVHRDMEILVFGRSGARVLVFPTRDGRFFDYENWGMVGAVLSKLHAGELQLFCVDSYDRFSLYAEWMRREDRMSSHLAYESYILDEVLPFSESLNPDTRLVAHGSSLGAFHAINITLRHPSRFTRAVAFSGRYDLTLSVGTFRGLFDSHYDDLVYFNNPSHYLPNVTSPDLLDQMRRIHVTLAVGEDDAFLQNNREFADVLSEKGIPHDLHVWTGEAHRPRWWRKMAAVYL